MIDYQPHIQGMNIFPVGHSIKGFFFANGLAVKNKSQPIFILPWTSTFFVTTPKMLITKKMNIQNINISWSQLRKDQIAYFGGWSSCIFLPPPLIVVMDII